jgi:S-adenosylmethionine hydrolase
VPLADIRRPGWPDDLPEIVHIDGYGNALTGLRAGGLPAEATLAAGGAHLSFARTFGERRPGSAFWYENSVGLAEIAVAEGSAAAMLGLRVGSPVSLA